MKLLLVSDTHVGHRGWNGFDPWLLTKARAAAEAERIDVMVFGGDLVEPDAPGAKLEDGLALLQQIPVATKLWVAGNNDIEFLFGQQDLKDTYMTKLGALARQFGVHLLDEAPVTVGDTTFVGNFGGYDISLWKPPLVPEAPFPSTYEEMLADAQKWFTRATGSDVLDFFNSCQHRLKTHIAEAAKAPKLVVASHTVPTPEFVLYGHSAKFDYQNAWMGWDDSLTAKPIHTAENLVLQLCGHTHRSEYKERAHLPNKAPLINMSGKVQPRILEI